MEAEARYTYVGAAVLILVAAAIAAVVWLKHAGSERNFSHYIIYFQEQALDGLQIGGDVLLRGIKVGRVDDYALSGKKLNRVRVQIRVDRRTPVLEHTVATISRNVVTGIAKIVLVNPASGGEPLTAIPPDEPYPVIAEGSNDLQQIAGRFAELGDRAADVLDSVNKLLSPQNQAYFAQALSNLASLTVAANSRVATLDRTVNQFSRSAAELSEAATRIAAAADKAATGLTDTGAKANANLEAALDEVKLTLIEARRASATIQTELANVTKRLDNTTISLDDQASAALNELRSGAVALNRTLDRFQDPRNALFGPSKGQLGPGEKK